MPSRPHSRIPEWLRVSLPRSRTFGRTQAALRELGLSTVCQGARCPNIFECFTKGTATFLILGNQCTRNCLFCNIRPGTPEPLQLDEPQRISQAVAMLSLSHVVVTSVTRDDLPDGGAGHFAAVINRLRMDHPGTTVEVLIPDFKGDRNALGTVLEARPQVLNHNIETVPRLYPAIRPQAKYRRSIQLLEYAAQMDKVRTKSGLMVGVGETDEEIFQVIDDLAAAGCGMVTIGQYLQPTRHHYPVQRYVEPAGFEIFREYGLKRGISSMFCGPLIRSSYHAAEHM